MRTNKYVNRTQLNCLNLPGLALALLCAPASLNRLHATPPNLATQPQALYAVDYPKHAPRPDAWAQFNVVAIGADLHFQWFHNGEPIPATVNPTAVSDTLTIARVKKADAGLYLVQVSNSHGQVTSETAELQVLGIVQSPQSVTAAPGGAVVLAVQATGPDLNYQWCLNGDLIAGAIAPTLTLENLCPADGGSYSVIVYNGWGSVASEAAAVVVDCPVLPFADRFAERGMIFSGAGCGQGDNRAATKETPRNHAGKKGRRSLWVSWTAPGDGLACFDTIGSHFDTLLAVYTGQSLNDLQEIASDDDSGGFHTSALMFSARAGAVYHLAVDALDSSPGGMVILNWQLTPAAWVLPTLSSPARYLTVLPSQAATLSVDYSSAEPLAFQWFHNGQPVPGANQPQLGLPSVSAAEVGLYWLRLATTDYEVFSRPIDLQINTEGILTAHACNKLDDARESGISPASTPTLNSQSQLSRKNVRLMRAAAQRVRLQTTFLGFGYNGTQVFSTTTGKDPDEPNACGVTGGASEWFSYSPPASGILSFNTDGSNFDTVLGVYVDDGRNLGYSSLVEVACDNNSGTNGQTSACSLIGTNGVTHYIMVDGVNGATGTAYLNYNLNEYPTISTISNQTINEDQSTGALSFNINDRETAAGSLTLSKASSSTTLVPTANIVFGGSGTNRTVTVTPALYKHGTATITITVTDGGNGSRSTSFVLTVNHVNHAPVPTSDYFTVYGTSLVMSVTTILSNDTDVDYDTLSMPSVASTSAKGAPITRNGNNITFTRPDPFPYTSDSFTYTVSDGQGGSATGTVNLNVLPLE
jgi:hypothetical protein